MRILHLCILLTYLATAVAQDIEWRHYGNDAGGKRFAAIDQIATDNVINLKQAWTFRTGEYELYQDDEYLTDRAAFEATPIVVQGVMYFPTPSNQLFALDAANGHKLWQFDPEIDLLRTEFSELTSRGVGYWEEDDKQRILMGTVDGRLFSIDAHTGKADTAFGDEGQIDLKLGVGLVQVTSAPAIWKDLVIIGTSIGDNNRTHDSRGVVRAFRISDGLEIWSFDPIPTDSDDPAFSKWHDGSAHRTGAANVWATISVDAEHNLVFLPTSSPSPDFYGGERLGNNDYANSVVALDASSGGYRWHFQVVHHDIWDYDIPAQPLLFDYPADDQKIPAVAIGTKMGHIFVLNRLTGEAILPYEERAVPQSDVPGEVSSPTQPFPIQPAPLGLQNLDLNDAWGPNPEALLKAQSDFATRRYEGVFTPPSMQGTIVAPGNTGGIHWGGMSYDPVRNVLVTNINRFAHLIQLHPRHDPDKFTKYLEAVRSDDNLNDPETNRMLGTPYNMSRLAYVQVQDDKGTWPMTKPPWGTLLALDITDGEKLWERPLGFMSSDSSHHEFGSINVGGTLLTASGLIFVAATMDNHFRAFDSASGDLLWESLLPASGIATPMSYYIDGKQYIAIAAGGHGKNPLTTKGDYILVFSL